MKSFNKMVKTFNKLLLLLMLILFSLVSANAGEVIFTQDEVIADMQQETSTINSNLFFTIVGSTNNKFLGNNSGDIHFEFSGVREPTFFMLENNQLNTSVTLSWLFEQGQLTHQEITLDELGNYYFEVNPSFAGENGKVMINLTNDASIVNAYVITNLVLEEQTLFSPLITGVVDLITINVALWKLGFYVVIFVFVIGTLILLMWLVMKFYKWSKEHRVFRNRSNHR